MVSALLPRPPRAVLFDLDGVLVDSFEIWVKVLDDCRQRRQLEPLARDEVLRAWGQSVRTDCESLLPGVDPAELALEYTRAFQPYLPLVRPIPGADRVLAALARAAIPLAVVTNSPRDLAHELLTAAGLRSWVPVLAGSDEVSAGKPDPALLHLALDRLGIDVTAMVLVGDTWNDLQAGRAAGIPVIGYRLDADARIEALDELVPLLGIEPAGPRS